jgi:hypothetical protein
MVERSARIARSRQQAPTPAIERVIVEGYKSHRDRLALELRPLTVLCGGNSSGKSSVMQALLLLKQTAGAEQVGPELRLDGPHVVFERFAELAWRRPGLKVGERAPLRLGVVVDGCEAVTAVQAKGAHARPEVVFTEFNQWKTLDAMRLVAGQACLELWEIVAPSLPEGASEWATEQVRQARLPPLAARRGFVDGSEEVGALQRAMLRALVRRVDLVHARGAPVAEGTMPAERAAWLAVDKELANVNVCLANRASLLRTALSRVLHLPGLRGEPQRRYQLETPVSQAVPMPFTQVFAGLLQRWQDERDERLSRVGELLRNMGLGWKVATKVENLTRVNLRVSRSPEATRGAAHDLVALPDVGFGVSQVLPVVVALVFAEAGQLVYLEQPELHLHPRAAEGLASAIVDAARRGVRLVVETHSETMLVSIQLAIAEGRLGADQAIFHWFRRDEEGASVVTSAEADELGRLGPWPADFGDSMLDLQGRFLAEVSARAKGRSHG